MKKEFDRIQLSSKPLPPAYHTVTPFLIVSGASNAIDFYRRAFGASELSRLPASGGKVRHAEIRIGNSPVMKLARPAVQRGLNIPKRP